jgi:hypothetical protein
MCPRGFSSVLVSTKKNKINCFYLLRSFSTKIGFFNIRVIENILVRLPIKVAFPSKAQVTS